MDTEFNFTNEWMKVEWHSDLHAKLKKRSAAPMAEDFPEGHFGHLTESAFGEAALQKKNEDCDGIPLPPPKRVRPSGVFPSRALAQPQCQQEAKAIKSLKIRMKTRS